MTADVATRIGRPPPPDPAHVPRIGEDSAVLEQLYRAHLDDVLGYLARRCPSPHDVADLVAETFLQAIESASGFDPRRGRPVAWLIGIARHVHLRHLRFQSTDLALVARIEGRRLLDDEDISRLEERIDAERLAKGLLGHLDALTVNERELIELVDLQGLTPTEAADTLRVSAGVARIRLHRARTRLRNLHHDGGQ